MNPNQLKALANGANRPLKTSTLNPYAVRRTPHQEVRIAPRVSAMRAQGNKIRYAGDAFAKPKRSMVEIVAESKANYVPQIAGSSLKADARQAAAAMVRRYRKTGSLSALTRLTNLNARLATIILETVRSK